MTDPDLHDDQVLLAYLSSAIDDGDPIPPAASAMAIAGFQLRRLDEQLAELVADSSVAPEVAMRRETPTTRALRFVAAGLTIEVEFGDQGGPALGVLSPASAIRIDVETVSSLGGPQRVALHSDDLGRFRAAMGPGLCRIWCYPGDETIVTPWFTR